MKQFNSTKDFCLASHGAICLPNNFLKTLKSNLFQVFPLTPKAQGSQENSEPSRRPGPGSLSGASPVPAEVLLEGLALLVTSERTLAPGTVAQRGEQAPCPVADDHHRECRPDHHRESRPDEEEQRRGKGHCWPYSGHSLSGGTLPCFPFTKEGACPARVRMFTFR